MSQLNSLGWLRGKKEAIINNNNNNNNNNKSADNNNTDNNNNNNNNNDFQNALNDALVYQTIASHLQRPSKLKPYINKYNWKRVNFLLTSKDWKKFEGNNKTIAFNVLYIPCNTKTIGVAYRSEYNNKCKKQVILLIISNGKKSHYFAVTNLSALLQGISSNRKEDFYCLNCFNSYTTKNKLKEHEEICNNHDSCCVEMRNWVDKILK